MKAKKRKGNPARRPMNRAEEVAFQLVVDFFGSREAAIDAINNTNPFTMERIERAAKPKRRRK